MEPESADVRQHAESWKRDAEPLWAYLISPPLWSAAARLTGKNQKVKHRLRLMSTSRCVSKCRWWQMAFLIQCVLQLPHCLWTPSCLTNNLLIPCHWMIHKTHIFSLQSSLTLYMYITLITTPSIGSSRAYRQPSYSPSDPAGTCWTAAHRACSPRRWEPTSCQGSHRRQMSMPPGTSRRWARWCPADAALASWSYREFSGPYGTGRPSALCGWKMMISIIYPQPSKCAPKTFWCFWVLSFPILCPVSHLSDDTGY